MATHLRPAHALLRLWRCQHDCSRPIPLLLLLLHAMRLLRMHQLALLRLHVRQLLCWLLWLQVL